MTISNDKELKAALAALSDTERRQVGTLLVQQVFDLSGDARIKGALELARRADAGNAELAVAAAGVNTARVESFTQCGRDTDWTAQAAHFVARAAQECVQPVVDLGTAWEAAMQARMARICQTLAAGEGTNNTRSRGAVSGARSILAGKGKRIMNQPINASSSTPSPASRAICASRRKWPTAASRKHSPRAPWCAAWRSSCAGATRATPGPWRSASAASAPWCMAWPRCAPSKTRSSIRSRPTPS